MSEQEDGTDAAAGADDAPDDGGGAGTGEAPDDHGTVPQVDLTLHEVSVSVSGRADDDLGDVADTARDLMTYLVGEAEALSDEPDQYGLS